MTTGLERPQPAGLPRRVAAAVYDGFLLMGLLFVATLPVIVLIPDHRVPAGTHWYQAYLLAVGFAFYAWFWTHGGQTLGMRSWRLRVESIDGSPVGWPQAVLRYPLAVMAWASVAGILACAVTRDRQALHDWASGTRTVVLPAR
jgi:uncharacterized RDD family membrane protein YckC